ncbi:MAG: leucyl-tRNA synthetase, partial [Lactococcus sp.]
NGKLKAKVMIEKDLPKDQLEKVALEAVEVEGNIVKVIAIPNKLVNIVVK